MFVAIPSPKGGLWHVFEGTTSLCKKHTVEKRIVGKMPDVDGAAWVKGQDCKPCWRLAGLPVGDGARWQASNAAPAVGS